MQILIAKFRTDNDRVDLCRQCFAMCQIIIIIITASRQSRPGESGRSGLTDTNLVNFVHHVNSDYLGPLLRPS